MYNNVNKGIVAGQKQTIKNIKNGKAKKVLIAFDADPMILEPILAMCAENKIPVIESGTMASLGKKAGIKVECAVLCYI